MDIFDEITRAIVAALQWLGKKMKEIIDIMLFRK